jgi:AcrR family transcriptional regulator
MRKSANGNKRSAIIKAAARLFRQKGYERTTVRDLAKAVRIQSGSIFFHFASKEQILEAVIAEGMQRAVAALDVAVAEARSPREKLAAIFRTHLQQTLGDERDTFVVLMLDWRALPPKSRKRAVAFRDEYEQHIGRVLDDLAQDGIVNQNTRLLRLFLLGALNWTILWYRESGRLSIDQLADAFLDLVLPAGSARPASRGKARAVAAGANFARLTPAAPQRAANRLGTKSRVSRLESNSLISQPSDTHF